MSVPVGVGGNAVAAGVAGVVQRLLNVQQQAKVAAQEALVQHEAAQETAAKAQSVQEGK